MSLIDTLMVWFSLFYYATLIVVFILRAHERSSLELKLAYVFSGFLIPFTLLWVANLLGDGDTSRLITGIPIVVFLVYDLWYRLLSRKKPLHHPERWPMGLYIYLLLLQFSSIMLNWYAFLISQSAGNLVLVSYFGMLAAFGYYQYLHKKKRAADS